MALADGSTLHQAAHSDAYGKLLTAAFNHVGAFPPLLRDKLALWTTAGLVFNTVNGGKGSVAPGLTPSNCEIFLDSMDKVAFHLYQSHIALRALEKAVLKQAKACASHTAVDTLASAGAAATANGKGSPAAATTGGDGRSTDELLDLRKLGPSDAMLKARLFDCLQKAYEGFKQPWLKHEQREALLGLFLKILHLPVPWWPHGRAQRTPLERWTSTMNARR